MHLRAAAAITPSGVPPMPRRMSAPDSVHAVAMAPATSPSVISRMRAPVERTSSIRSAWRGRSRITAVTSRTDSPLASATARMLSVGRLLQADLAGGLRPHRQLLHVDARARIEHGAALAHGDHRRGRRPGRARSGWCRRWGRRRRRSSAGCRRRCAPRCRAWGPRPSRPRR